MNRAERRAQWLTQHRQQQLGTLPAAPSNPSSLFSLASAGSSDLSSSLSSSVSPPAIQLHIETLSLQGFPPLNRYAIRVALEQELTRLVTQQGLPTSWSGQDKIPQLHAGSFRLTPGARGQTVGTQIAQAMYSSPQPGDRPLGGRP